METALGLALNDALAELLPEGHEEEKNEIAQVFDSVLLRHMQLYADELRKAEIERKKSTPSSPDKKKPASRQRRKADIHIEGNIEEYTCYMENWTMDVKNAKFECMGRILNQLTPELKTSLHKAEPTRNIRKRKKG
ncbi:hypothetical protein THRCLA_21283 [Thraustotheca clavata]|uniref:Uncharacterized protein n=1 Tax=Thraustotheca clavata TaxID=74557 RepID=A0A1V9ZY50_9STRA|nr:hypothetical protein THRCLA_21283 [Thraustotheca clavata]